MILNGFFGGHKAVVRPDPIPNSDVKRSIADGSAGRACVRVGCRQIYFQSRTRGFGFFLIQTKLILCHNILV